ncbi:MAG TPA: DUF4870 domain-containing protein [Streptosporangiaceae bacterium]
MDGEPVRDPEVTLAIFGYLAAAFLGPVIPLGIYLTGRSRRVTMAPFTRDHTVMALNLSVTWLLYAVCCLILGGLLTLDSLDTALVVTIPIALALWLTTVRYLIRGIGAANRGERATAPAWICARIVRALPAQGVTGPGRSRSGRHSVSARATVSASSRPRRVRTIRPCS